jgi:hypothetical protein
LSAHPQGAPRRRRLYLDTSAYLCILLAEQGWEGLSTETDGAELLSSVILILETRRNLIRLAREGALKPDQYKTCIERMEQDTSLFVLRDLTLDLCQSNLLPAVTTRTEGEQQSTRAPRMPHGDPLNAWPSPIPPRPDGLKTPPLSSSPIFLRFELKSPTRSTSPAHRGERRARDPRADPAADRRLRVHSANVLQSSGAVIRLRTSHHWRPDRHRCPHHTWPWWLPPPALHRRCRLRTAAAPAPSLVLEGADSRIRIP